MKRVMVLSGVLFGCLGPGPAKEKPKPDVVDPPIVTCDPDHPPAVLCSSSEPGDPEQIIQGGGCYTRPTCDLALMNRPSTSPAEPLNGVDAPTPELQEVAQLMVGQWHGTQTNVSAPNVVNPGPYPVLLTFFENGRYSGTVFDDEMFLFGDGESCAYHREFWRLEAGGKKSASGKLKYGVENGTGCFVVELRNIEADGSSLRFEVWGPLIETSPWLVDLKRTEVIP